ncbi:lipid IV(A) palmitoyltransferase PagP [Xenorhabdus vietnamensis]|uniref:lipid IV(A) palmitoyltransferase PagP n=1 Tax=Xenorhabdus vietnamensis TaxID=351656 RepID=UPI000A321DBB|nr:lipid IV(A) palmitoyltransferase PagP [Xenorhabdus vietnamensis]
MAEKDYKYTSSELWENFRRNILSTWDSPDNNIYLPVITWHNRFTYDKDNNWHSLYAMAFMDSHNRLEPIVGYGFQKMWTPNDLNDSRIGGGFTLNITARHDYYYIPLPLPLPIFSIEYNWLALQTTYIPCKYNNGNVLFSWLRWQW